jgi:hypothetical protein
LAPWQAVRIAKATAPELKHCQIIRGGQLKRIPKPAAAIPPKKLW